MKKLKGIISNWYQRGDRVCGNCVWHADGVSAEKAVMSPRPDEILIGLPIVTSRLVAVKDSPSDQFAIIETANSFYILLQPGRDAAAKLSVPQAA